MSNRRKIARTWCGREPGHSLVIAARISNGYFRVSDNPDATEQKSIDGQRAERDEWVPRAAVRPGEDYTDDDRSASQYQSREREAFARLRADIDASLLDGHVLWVYTTSRLSRGDVPIDTFARQCAAHGIVWCVNGHVLNPACSRDMVVARMNHVVDQSDSDRLSEFVTDGKKRAALAGKPSVKLYGYRRVYKTGADGMPVLVKGRPVIERDKWDEVPPPGRPATDSPAYVVREIFARIEDNATLSAIARSLEDRRIPAPRHPRKCTTCGHKFEKGDGRKCPAGHAQDPCQWHASAVRFIATNVGYLGKRIYQAGDTSLAARDAAVLDGVTALWDPLIEPAQFWRVRAILADASRVRWTSPNRGNSERRPPAREYVLVPAARCGECGDALGGHTGPAGDSYKCRERGCVSVRADWLERWAEDRLVSWLVLPEVRSQIWGSREADSARQAAALAELENLGAELAEARDLNRARRISPVAFADREQAILAAIDTANAALKSGPTVLHDVAGPDAADRWVALKAASPDAARGLLAEVAVIYVNQAATRGGGVTRGPDESRFEWHWKIGDTASTPRTRDGTSGRLRERRARLDASRRKAEEILLADPSLADAVAGRRAGCAYGTAARVRAQLEAAGKITDPGYRTGQDGRRYQVADDPRKVTGRGRELLPPEEKACEACGTPFTGHGDYCGNLACFPSTSKQGRRDRYARNRDQTLAAAAVKREERGPSPRERKQAEVLRLAREEPGLSRAEIAARAGVDESTVTRIRRRSQQA